MYKGVISYPTNNGYFKGLRFDIHPDGWYTWYDLGGV